MKDLIEIRYKELEPNLSDRWMWPKKDTGAWTGPFEDWKSHKNKYFEHVKNFNTIVTAGANCGAYVRAYAVRFENVYAFEPDWLNFYCMSYNNPEENVYKFMAGLGSEAGACEVNRGNSTNVGMHKAEYNQNGNVPMLTIDSLNLSHCDCIQLDVEGYEFEILKGAEETISKHHPVIIVERNQDKINKYLEKFGYSRVNQSVADFIYKFN